jgi:hypothetical protein
MTHCNLAPEARACSSNCLFWLRNHNENLTAGACVIASLAKDNAEPKKNRRLDAMRNAVADDPHAPDIATGFYDHARLQQWLREYPSVMP